MRSLFFLRVLPSLQLSSQLTKHNLLNFLATKPRILFTLPLGIFPKPLDENLRNMHASSLPIFQLRRWIVQGWMTRSIGLLFKGYFTSRCELSWSLLSRQAPMAWKWLVLMGLFDACTLSLPAMLQTTQNNALLPAQNMVHASSARLLLMTFKTWCQQKVTPRNGLNKSSRRPNSKRMASLKDSIHTACRKMFPAVSIGRSGMASHSATFIVQLHPAFCTSFIKEFSSIWSVGARESSLLRNWTVAFKHFLLPMVFDNLKMEFLPCLRYLVPNIKTWPRSSLAALLDVCPNGE